MPYNIFKCISATTCALSLIAIFGSSLSFAIGLWPQSEIVTLIFHISAALLSVGLSGVFFTSSKAISLDINPAAIAAILIFSLGITLLPFHQFLFLDLYGMPELGDGVLLYLSIAILLIGFSLLNKDNRYRFIFHIIFLLSMLFSVLLSNIGTIVIPQWSIVISPPYTFPDYLAFFSLYGAYIGLKTWQDNKLLCACTILISIICLICSNNTTAQIGLPLLFVICFTLRAYVVSTKPLYTLAFATIFILAPILFVFILVTNNAEIPPISSIGSRYHLARVAIEALLDNPLLLIKGFGWGHYTEVLINYSADNSISSVHTLSENYWDALTRIDFSSHNVFLDQVLAGGLLALILFSGLIVTPLLCKHASYIDVFFGFSLILLHSLWFQMPATIPGMIYAMSFIEFRSIAIVSNTKIIFTGLLFFLCSITILISTYFSVQPALSIKQTNFQNKLLADDCKSALHDESHGSYYTSSLLRHSLILKSTGSNTYNFNKHAKLLCLLEISESTLEKHFSLILASTNLSVRADIASLEKNDISWRNTNSSLVENWNQRLNDFLSNAPNRSDMAIPYLTWAISQGEFNEAEKIIHLINSNNNQNVIALWFSGTIEIQFTETKNSGLNKLKLALENNIEQYLPVSDDLKNNILGAR